MFFPIVKKCTVRDIDGWNCTNGALLIESLIVEAIALADGAVINHSGDKIGANPSIIGSVIFSYDISPFKHHIPLLSNKRFCP